MKNYPLLTINNHNLFYNWRNNYVKPLLNQVKDLSYYSYFMIPPYREFKKEIPSEESSSDYDSYNIINTSTDPEELNFNDMPVHSYLQLTEETKVSWDGNELILPAGTWVVSEARNEGQNSLIDDFNHYTYMPGGYGSFYVLTRIDYVKTEPDENDNNEVKDYYNMVFTYLRNAGEIYGYSPKSNLIFNINRFILKYNRINLEQYGKTINSTLLGVQKASNDDFIEWYTLGNPMHFIFTTDGASNYGEEVILDENHLVNLEYENTHSYTINSKHDDVRSFYVDFI